MLQSESCTHR